MMCFHCVTMPALVKIMMGMQAIAMGASKATAPFDKTLLSAVLAGAYVGFGGMIALTVGANLPEIAASNPGLQKLILGGFGLPAGLMLVSHSHTPVMLVDQSQFLHACMLAVHMKLFIGFVHARNVHDESAGCVSGRCWSAALSCSPATLPCCQWQCMRAVPSLPSLCATGQYLTPVSPAAQQQVAAIS